MPWLAGYTVSAKNRIHKLVGDHHDEAMWLGKLREAAGYAVDNIEASAIDMVSGLGHGAALHFPDMPWAKWSYESASGETVHRDNLPDFVKAADMACKVVRAYLARTRDFVVQAGLPTKAKDGLEKLLSLNRDHDEKKRYVVLAEQAAAGVISGFCEEIPPYIPEGPGSWKALATGIEATDGDGSAKPTWTRSFEQSDYRYFREAVKEHRFVVTQDILPKHGVRRT